MTTSATCWTLLQEAAEGGDAARERFARLYLPVVEGYLAQRWRGSARAEDIEDARQQVLLECLRPEGVLDRALEKAERGFRAYLYGVTVNIARRIEGRRRPLEAAASAVLGGVEASDAPVSEVFDRGWATALAREAGERYRETADTDDPRALRRVRVLEMRFGEGLPIREIAVRWGVDAAALHHDYATARQGFLKCLRDVIRFHHPGGEANVERELADLVARLG